MSSLNLVVLIGNLGADPEARTFDNGGKVVNFRIATSDRWTDKNTGEKKERTEWHSICVLNENIASIAEQYLSKGSKVMVKGSLRTRKWQDQSGNDRYTTEIVLSGYDAKLVLLDGRSGGDRESGQRDSYGDLPGTGGGGGGYQEPAPHRGASKGAPPPNDFDDEIPF